MRYAITSPLSSEGLLNHAVIFMTTGINSFRINAGFRELYLPTHNANLELTRAYAVHWSLPLHPHFCPH